MRVGWLSPDHESRGEQAPRPEGPIALALVSSRLRKNPFGPELTVSNIRKWLILRKAPSSFEGFLTMKNRFSAAC
jgi:hypothetical protein